MAKESSPFKETEFVPIQDIYTVKDSVFGLRKPDGTVVLNFDHKTSYPYLKEIARLTGTELIVVYGTWTFIPDTKE